MDQTSIQLAANELEAIALDLVRSGHEDVRAFYATIRPLVERAKQGAISAPLEWRHIPGGRSFLETNLRAHTKLEHAFARFRLAVTGIGPNISFEADGFAAAQLKR